MLSSEALELIDKMAKEYGLDPAFCRCLIAVVNVPRPLDLDRPTTKQQIMAIIEESIEPEHHAC